MNRYIAAGLALLAFAVNSISAEILTETQYFTDGYKPTFKIPEPSATWQVYLRKRVLRGSDAIGVEILEGPDAGTTMWSVGRKIVSISKSGTPTVYDKVSGEAVLWQAPQTSITWFKKLEPVHTEKQGEREVLVYETGGGFRRVWVDSQTKLPIAQIEGKQVTFYDIKKDDGDIEPPPAVKKALAENKKQEQKLSEYGAMPQ